MVSICKSSGYLMGSVGAAVGAVEALVEKGKGSTRVK